MKKLFAVFGVAFSVAMATSAVRAEVTAEFSFDVVSAQHLIDVGAKKVTGDRLYASVTMNGIAPGEKFEYYFQWTSPSDMFHSSEYPTAADRSSGEKKLYAGDDACDELVSRCQCYCKYEGENAEKAGLEDGTIVRGCWRTRAYRTVVWTHENGTAYRATGTWKVELIRVNSDADVVIATGEHEVN